MLRREDRGGESKKAKPMIRSHVMHDFVKDDRRGRRSLEHRLLRLREMNRLCSKILSQIPGSEQHRVDDLPASLADKIAGCDCATLNNVVRACLLRLIGEAIAPSTSRKGPDRANLDVRGP